MMQITLEKADESPLYRQIARQIREGVDGGRLNSGDRLTSHRELAAQLGVAPLTVKKAYDELEILGLAETRRGRGTFVGANVRQRSPQERRDEVKAMTRRVLAKAVMAGLTLDDVLEMLSEVEREIRGS